ncbi:MAG: DUF5683 domain-containing protein [Bacteroidota bacterium]
MIKSLVTLLCLFFHFACFCQPPSWLGKPPVNHHQAPFKYYTGSGNSYQDAIVEALIVIASRGGVEVAVARERLKTIGPDLLRKIENKESITIDFGKKSFNVQLVEQANWKNKRHVLYALRTQYAREDQSPGRLKAIGFVRRSLVVPSWGQFYNREPVKATTFATGFVALSGLALIGFSQANNSSNNAQLALATGNLISYNNFLKNRNQWQTMGRISIISAVVLWVINVVDAASSEKNIYALNDQKSMFSLYASNNSLGIQYSF